MPYTEVFNTHFHKKVEPTKSTFKNRGAFEPVQSGVWEPDLLTPTAFVPLSWAVSAFLPIVNLRSRFFCTVNQKLELAISSPFLLLKK